MKSNIFEDDIYSWLEKQAKKSDIGNVDNTVLWEAAKAQGRIKSIDTKIETEIKDGLYNVFCALRGQATSNQSEKDKNTYTIPVEDYVIVTTTVEKESIASTLRTVVGQVYRTIRDICILALFIVIIYLLIRRVMSINPREKSDLAQTVTNCIVGLCLILTMHYIMSISVTLFEELSKSIALSNTIETSTEEVDDDKANEIKANEIKKEVEEGNAPAVPGLNIVYSDKLYNKLAEQIDKNELPNVVVLANGGAAQTELGIITRNLTEHARLLSQEVYELDDNGDKAAEKWSGIGWSFVYVMMIILTIAFIWLYGKRVIYMAALTMFAPIVGVMYPINKMHGAARAHALSTWLRMYMGNLVMQPLQLFIYVILVGSAMAIAYNNPIYVIIALMGLLYVEKLLKNLIGLPEDTMGGLGSALRDTTRAIKTSTDMAKSVVRTAGNVGASAVRTTSQIGMAVRNSMEANKENESQENNENTGREPRRSLPPNAQSEQMVLSAYNEEAAEQMALPPHDESKDKQVLVETADGVAVLDYPDREQRDKEKRARQLYEKENGKEIIEASFRPIDDELDEKEPEGIDSERKDILPDKNSMELDQLTKEAVSEANQPNLTEKIYEDDDREYWEDEDGKRYAIGKGGNGQPIELHKEGEYGDTELWMENDGNLVYQKVILLQMV